MNWSKSTVEPAVRDHSREIVKVVSYSRWSLNTGVLGKNPQGGGGAKRERGDVFCGIISLLGHCYLHLCCTSSFGYLKKKKGYN